MRGVVDQEVFHEARRYERNRPRSRRRLHVVPFEEAREERLRQITYVFGVVAVPPDTGRCSMGVPWELGRRRGVSASLTPTAARRAGPRSARRRYFVACFAMTLLAIFL